MTRQNPRGNIPRLFKRWDLGWGRTWAYRLFKAHHTELNNLYWAHAPALRFAFAATRGVLPTSATNTLFRLGPPNDTRINLQLKDWGRNYGAFDNWVRLSALVAITGYLEIYIGAVVRLAIESDPGITLGMSRSVDGVKALKRGSKQKSAEHVKSCIIGRWSDRVQAYKNLFGIVPRDLQDGVSSLDRLRLTRNGVAHSFGRGSNDYRELLQTKAKPFRKISEVQLQKALGLADTIALAIDNHLGSAHIGDFESVLFYHRWDKVFDITRQTESTALRAMLYEFHGRNRGPAYYEELIRYYNQA
jgi:hypothetical protein